MAANTVGGSYSYNVICKVCGFKYKAHETRRRWDGLEPVCETCWEPRHPLDFYRTRNDTHKLSMISSEQEKNNRLFPVDFDPTISIKTGTGDSYGTRVRASVSGYLTAVNVYWGDPAVNSRKQDLVQLAIYNSVGTAVWSKSVYLTPGQWNSVPVVPNVFALATSQHTITVYRPTTGSLGYTTPIPTIPASDYMTFVGSYTLGSNALGFPNSADATNLYLIDVTMRPS